MTSGSDQSHSHAHVAIEARRQRRARWATGAGLAVAAGATVAVLATAQGSPNHAVSPVAADAGDASQVTVGVNQAGITSPAIEPAPPAPAASAPRSAGSH